MLLLGRGARQIEGYTIFPDHENPKQFWYLSGPVSLAQRNDSTVFTLIKYNKKAKDKGAKGGGFVTFEVNLNLPDKIESSIKSKLPDGAVLAPVPFDKGTVKCLALDVDKEQMLGAGSPSLYDDNSAIFSLTLNENQATILEQAYNGSATPIGVIYELEYTAMRPTLDVRLEADLKRVYTEFQARLGASGFAKGFALKGEIQAGFQQLIQEGAIKVDIVTFVDDEDTKQQRETALQLFMDTLLKDWFVPTLNIPKLDEEDKDDLPLNETTKNEDTATNTDENKPIDGVGEDLKDTVDAVEDVAEDVIPQAKLTLRFVRQEEQKKVTYVYRGAQATRKTYFPQGFFSRLLSDVDNKKGIVTADLDDPFFRTISIDVQAPEINYEKYGIQSLHFAAKYPNREIESRVFDKDNNTAQPVEFAMNKNLETSYNYQVQYNFLPDSGWEGERVTYEIPWAPTEDRTQVLLPHEQLDFLDVAVTLERNFYWGNIQEARVFISYKSPNNKWNKEKLLRFTPDSATEQHCKLRLSDRKERKGEDPSYTYYIEYQRSDDSVQKTERVTTKIQGIVVNDLTKKKLPVKFISQLSANERAFIDVSYEDLANDFRWDKSLEIGANNTAPIEIQIPLVNPTLPQFQYTITFLKADGRRLSQTLPLGIYHRSPILVNSGSDLEVNLSPDSINWELVRTVTVNLLYQDLPNNIRKAETKTFNKGDKSAIWKVALANQSLRSYQWQASYYLKDISIGEQGLVRYPELKDTWNTTDESVILIDRYQPKSNKPTVKEGELEVEISPEDIDWDVVRRITVNLSYQDALHNIDASESKTFRQNDDSFIWNIALADKNLRTYQWQATFFMKDASVGEQGKLYYPATKGTWETSTDSVLFLNNYKPKPQQEQELLEVSISAQDLDWAIVNKIQVSLTYQDQENQIEVQKNITLTKNNSLFLWSFPITNVNHKQYQWQANFSLVNQETKTIKAESDSNYIDLDPVLDDLL